MHFTLDTNHLQVDAESSIKIGAQHKLYGDITTTQRDRVSTTPHKSTQPTIFMRLHFNTMAQSKSRQYKMNTRRLYLLTLLHLFSCDVVSGFFSSLSSGAPKISQQRQQSTTMSRKAIIYGWDDYEEEEDKKPKPVALEIDGLPFLSKDACDAQGAAVAEELTTQKLDSLARLAFSFRPKEHEGLELEEIEQVHVLCVNAHEIQMEAILCESMGCVSLHIPVEFPQKCSSDNDFQTCVLQNIQALDQKAESTVITPPQGNNYNEISALLSEPLQAPPPSWWVEATTDDLKKECNLLQEILTEDLEEFKTELIALAKEGLSDDDADSFHFDHAKCLKVGPAGMGLKAVGQNTDKTTFSMDVWFPFGTTHATSKQLRAAVLGAVASAASNEKK